MFKTKEGVLCFTTPYEKILFDAIDEIYKLKGMNVNALDCDNNEFRWEGLIEEWEVKSICEETMKKLNNMLEEKHKNKEAGLSSNCDFYGEGCSKCDKRTECMPIENLER